MLILQFIPHSEIQGLNTAKRIKKLLDIAKQNKIVVLEGRLKKEEETELIRITMEEIDDKFKGIEIGVFYPEARNIPLFDKIKSNIANMILGERTGLTIIGPASIIKEIKKDPNKIQLLTKDVPRVRKRKRKK